MTWRRAMEEALYGSAGFYRRGERPSAHFRTSVHASPAFGEALLRLLTQVDESLGHPDRIDLVDIGAGQGELLTALMSGAPRQLAVRLRPCAVEVAPRPTACSIQWREDLPDKIVGLVVANEWLDNVPLDVAEMTGQGPRIIEVERATGHERPGAEPSAEDLAWLRRWWPLTSLGARAELGRTRDAAWAAVVVRLARGLAVAIDYGHSRRTRPAFGTLAGYRDGGAVPPVPDGSCDITAHVALDSCAEAGAQAARDEGQTFRTTQRDALRSLGLSGNRPPLGRAGTDPRDYLASLARASEEAELLDRTGLGGFGWIVQSVGIPSPPLLSPQTA